MSAFFKYDVFRGCIPVPKMVKYVLRSEKKIDFSLCLGFPLGINVHKDEYTNWGHFKKHSAKSLTMAK